MLVSRAGLSPVMVGRDAELGQLLRLLAVHTGGSIALIGGEPGIGKTRLVSELLSAVPPGTAVFIGQADPGALGTPYHLLLDLLGGPAELRATLADADATPQERADAGLAALREVIGGDSTVLVIDDLHWADPESMGVIEHLIDAPTGRLLVLGTYRPEELTRRHPVADLLQRLERRHAVTHLRLNRLSPADVGGVLAAVYGQPPSHRSALRLHQRTGGNPFFLEELLRACGETDPDRISEQPLPWTLAEALRSQLDDLEPGERRVVEAAAVLGIRVSFDLLAAVTGTGEAELIGTLRDLVGRGLLVESEDDQFGFRHALTREVIAGEMLGRERRRLHEAALAVLRASECPDLAAIAVHARGAGRYADMVDATRRGSAARLAAGSTYAALKLAELGLEEEPDEVPLLETAANAAWLAGYYPDAEKHAQRWLRASGTPAERVGALRVLGRLAWETADLKSMDARAAEVASLVPSLADGPERAQACAALAQSCMLRNRYPEAIEWAEAAIEVATRLDLVETRLTAQVEKGTAQLWLHSTHEAGVALLTEVANEAERAGAYVAATRALHNLFWQKSLAAIEQHAALLERMRVNSERGGYLGNSDTSYYEGKSRLGFLAGDLEAAIAPLEEARRLDRSWPPAPRVAALASPLTALYIERGRLDLAEVMLREVPEYAWHWFAPGVLAFTLACRMGDLAKARLLLADLGGEQSGDLPCEHPRAALDMVAGGLALGLPAADLRAVLPADRTVRDKRDEPLLWTLIDAQLAEAEGDRAAALVGYQAVADVPGWDVDRHIRGTARVGAARCLVALGRLDEAREQVTAAAELLARWAGWRRSALDQVARRLGLSASPVDVAVPADTSAALTPREREVAALLAEGLTNLELARRLVISRKTAAVHVSNILAKLGMTSRAQIAAWASRESAG